MGFRLVRAVHFSAAYRYAHPKKSETENRKVFGPLYSNDGLGCNFKLEAEFSGELNPETGMIENLTVIDQWLKAVAGELDHRSLAKNIAAFKDKAASLENITVYCFRRLNEEMQKFYSKRDRSKNPEIHHGPVQLKRVRIYEDEFTWFDALADERES